MEERIFTCIECKKEFKESDANYIINEYPNECVCEDCFKDWVDSTMAKQSNKIEDAKEIAEELVEVLKSFKLKLSKSVDLSEQTDLGKLFKDVNKRVEGIFSVLKGEGYDFYSDEEE